MSSSGSWFGNLKGQLTEFTKEVLAESIEENPEDERTQLKVAKDKIAELETELKDKTKEVNCLKSQNAELTEHSHNLELQMRSMNESFQTQLQEKNLELWQQQKQRPTFSDEDFSPPESPTSADFEMAQLRDEIKQLKAEAQHWKTVVKSEGNAETLLAENTDLKQQLEKHQEEFVALQRHYSAQLEAMKQEQRSGWDDTWSEGNEKEELGSESSDQEIARQLQQLQEQHDAMKNENEKLKSAKNDLEGAISANRDANQELRKTVDSLKDWEPDDDIGTLKAKLMEADENMRLLAEEHEAAIEQVLKSKRELEATVKEKSEAHDLERSKNQDLERQLTQMKAENLELTSAYDDINSELEKERQETGNISSTNSDLNARLEGLKADLIEYEEKYESCKADNLKARQQLDSLTQQFDRLKDDLGSAQSMSHGETQTLRTEVDRLQQELYDSLKKRDTLAKEMNSFTDVVNKFEGELLEYRSINEALREENSTLRESLQNLPGYKEIFAETEKDLSQIRSSIKEYQEQHFQKEQDLNDEIEELKQLNEKLKMNALEISSSEFVPDELENLRRLNEEQQKTIEELTATLNEQDETLRNRLVEAENVLSKFRNCVDEDTYRQICEKAEEDEMVEMLLVPQHLTSHSTPSQPSPKDEDRDSGDSNGWDRLREEHQKPSRNEAISGTLSSSQLEIQLREALAALTEKTEECEKIQKQLTEITHELHEKEDLLQQVFTELKGLEMQIVDYREREEVLRGNIQKLTVETARKDAEMSTLRTGFESSAEREQELEEQLAQQSSELQRLNAEKSVEDEQEFTAKEISLKLEEENRVLMQELAAAIEKVKFLTKELEVAKENISNLEASVMKVKENFEQEKSDATSENEQKWAEEKNQLVLLVNQKHEENVRYHSEITRLAELLAKEQAVCAAETKRAEELSALHAQHGPVHSALQEEIQTLTLNNTRLQKENASFALKLKKVLSKMMRSESEEDIKLETDPRWTFQTLKEQISEFSALLIEDDVCKASPIKEINEDPLSVKGNESANELSELRIQLEAQQKAKSSLNGELSLERERANKLALQIQELEQQRQKKDKESERLRLHLMQVEENYTTEAVASEERETELRARIKELERKLVQDSEEVKDKSQQLGEKLEDTETQLRSIAQQRDMALLELADKQEELDKATTSLASLKDVLHHFQQERESSVLEEVERYQGKLRKIEAENTKLTAELAKQAEEFQRQKAEWTASDALRTQLSAQEKRIGELELVVHGRDAELAELQARLSASLRVQGEKVDKDVLKNLMLSYFAAPKDKKNEVAHLLGSVLSFSEEEFRKMHAGEGGSWLAFLGSGGSGPSASSSIATQFVQFLEAESRKEKKAEPLMTIPEMSARSSRSSTPTGHTGSLLRQQMIQSSGGSPASLTVVPPNFQLPSFSSDMMHSSSSTSDFLKDVLSHQ